MFWIREVDLEEYAKRAKNRDQVILPNNLENFFFYLGILLMIWGFTVWGLLQFETTYVFVESLNEFFPAKGFYFIGLNFALTADHSLFSRKVDYCRGKNKKDD